MKKKVSYLVLFSVGIIILISGCSTPPSRSVSQGSQITKSLEEKTIEELKTSIDFYNQKIETELPAIAHEKNQDKMIAVLTETINRLDADTDKYLSLMNNAELSQNTKDACMNVKNAFYATSEKALKPMLDVYKRVSNNVPKNYKDIISTACDYLDTASSLIK